jgi:hypothetical protein
VLTHARQGLVHLQGFAGGSLRELSPLWALGLEECADKLRAACAGKPAWLLGSGLSRNAPFFAGLTRDFPSWRALPPDFDHPSPAFLLRHALALPPELYRAKDISPLYARPSEAEENLPRIAAKLGLDSRAAGERLAALLQGEVKTED